MFAGRRSCLTRVVRFSHWSCSLEGDAGTWAIVEHRGDEERLLLYGDWSWHTGRFILENRRLTSAEAGIMASLAGDEKVTREATFLRVPQGRSRLISVGQEAASIPRITGSG